LAHAAFTERTSPPTPEQAREATGSAVRAWDALADYVADAYRARAGLRFYGRNYGWAMTYRSAGVTLLALFPDRGLVTALVVLPGSCVETALGLDPPLGRGVLDQLEGATAFREGRWLFIPVHTEAEVEDVQRLVALKRPPRARRG
jgi:Protein of unknown function (DUF3788)